MMFSFCIFSLNLIRKYFFDLDFSICKSAFPGAEAPSANNNEYQGVSLVRVLSELLSPST